MDFPGRYRIRCNVGDLGSIPGFGRYPGEGNGYPLQYSDLGISMDMGSQSQTQLSDFHFHFSQRSLVKF